MDGRKDVRGWDNCGFCLENRRNYLYMMTCLHVLHNCNSGYLNSVLTA